MKTDHSDQWPTNWKRVELPALDTVSASETSVIRDMTTVRLRRRIASLEEKNRNMLACLKSLQSCVENDVGLWRMMDKVIRALEEDSE